MKRNILFILFVFFSFQSIGQNNFQAQIQNDKTKEVLTGASVFIQESTFSASSDSNGRVILRNIPNGKFRIQISLIGFISQERIITFPLQNRNQLFYFELEPRSGELAEVVVQSTRTDENLRDIPTRVEALPLEELDEKSSERPGDIKMLLGETTGIQVQSTSAVSGTASFRIEGLDSRYTQLLQDGMPLYAGFSGSLSLLQISPLNLKQVEFIKGSESTLYGGGAIAGLINLISKTPEKNPELTFLINGSSAKGLDLSSFYSSRGKHFGTTLFTSYNYNGAYDPSHTGFTAIPQTNRLALNPKFYYYSNNKNSGWFGINGVYENRLGGDIQVINGHSDSLHQYFEQNKTFRFSTQLSFTHKVDSFTRINLKNTIGYFNRNLAEAAFQFKGGQIASFSEINIVRNCKRANWVAGINLVSDQFTALPPDSYLSYHQVTLGGFLQNTYKPAGWFSLESGIRIDKNIPAPNKPINGVFLLPRVNALFKFNSRFTSRIGGGLGYKMPNLFNDQSEEEGYQNLQPLNIGNTLPEKSLGFNGDLNYRKYFGDIFLNINQLFFFTKIAHALILQNNAFVNAPGYLSSQGAETNIKLSMDEFKFYAGYTFTDARLHNNGQNLQQTLTPKNRVSLDITYEIENSFRFGIESFYTSPQLLSDGTTGRQFIQYGLLIQKMWKNFDIFINGENLTDRRQSRWGSLYTGTITQPKFKDIYAPLDGVVVNAGIRVKLLND